MVRDLVHPRYQDLHRLTFSKRSFGRILVLPDLPLEYLHQETIDVAPRDGRPMILQPVLLFG